MDDTRRAVAWVKTDPFGVEFADISLAGRQVKDITLDSDGIVIDYPGIARRLSS